MGNLSIRIPTVKVFLGSSRVVARQFLALPEAANDGLLFRRWTEKRVISKAAEVTLEAR